MEPSDRIELIPADHPSGVLRIIAGEIGHDQWWSSNDERTEVLTRLARDERLSAAHCDASPEAERRRAEICAHWALSVAAPMALDAAAKRLRPRYPELAESLVDHATKLRAEPTADNGRDVFYAAVYPYVDVYYDDQYAAAAYDTAYAALFADERRAANRVADAATLTTYAARSAHRAGADVRPEMIKLFDRLLGVPGGTP